MKGAIDPLMKIKYYNKIKLMIPFKFKPDEDPSKIPGPVPVPICI